MRRSRCTLTRVACDDPSMIKSEELQVDGRPALLTVPAEGPVRAGVVALHGSSSSSYRQVIFEHLANTLAPRGIAVLSFERAPWPTDDVDIPYAVQAAGAVAAYDELRSRHAVPIGFWGVSQGTWIAALAASERPETAFLVLLGCSGVSPAEQMRHATVEAVRRAGYDEEAVAGDSLLLPKRAVIPLRRIELHDAPRN